jgi:uncharacterized membrane protein YccC
VISLSLEWLKALLPLAAAHILAGALFTASLSKTSNVDSSGVAVAIVTMTGALGGRYGDSYVEVWIAPNE